MYTVSVCVSHFTLKEQLKIQRANPKETSCGNKDQAAVNLKFKTIGRIASHAHMNALGNQSKYK